ncbi:hypothetical protein CHS0354_007058 [Potamilus streckersoni]|uniref:Uncharacterized protein n=2 Tax=Potamilus streckersoni TaxID=2493646 RepID=A0AAE0SBM4_9BIVA|nr:hypothetical protein CHS0354_007058 [Potamilus streckersoni]
MSLRGFLVFLEIFIIWAVAKSFPVQQERLDGASVKNALEESSYKPVVMGNKGSGGMELQKTTPNSLFICFDLDICRTGLDFCNERRKACEKCEDYEHTCGSNNQPVGCTNYCVDLLVAKKLQEIEEANTSVTSEKPPESKEKTETLDIKWIVIGIMGLTIIVLLGIIGCREYKRKQSATKEKTETQMKLLEKDVETPIEESNLSYSSVPLQYDKDDVILPIPSAPSISQEISDPDQTKPKMNKDRDKCLPSTNQGPEINDLSQGRQQQDVEAYAEKKTSPEIQQREVEGYEPTSSGYSSALSTPSHSRPGSASVTNNICKMWT